MIFYIHTNVYTLLQIIKFYVGVTVNLQKSPNYIGFYTQALEFRTPLFSSIGPSRDYGMDLCLEVHL